MSSIAFASENTSNSFNKTISEHNLEVVSQIPNGIKPIMVNSIEELDELLNVMDSEVKSVKKHAPHLVYNNNTRYTFSSYMSSSFEGNQIDKRKIFKLSDIGAYIYSEVSYDRTLVHVPVGPPSWELSIDYHDVYEDGIYGFQEIKYDKKNTYAKLTNKKRSIDVRVKGYSKVYIGISGGGASGNIVLKTYRFDEEYTLK